MNTKFVRDWMRSPAVVIPETTLLPRARELLAEQRVRRLPVLDEHGALMGIVTQGDIFSHSASPVTDVQDYDLYYTLAHLPVREFMTREVITASPDMPIVEVAQLMLNHKIGGMPVVEEGRVVGIITESDIFRLLIAQERQKEGGDTVTR